MHSLIRIRVAAYSIMLASAGALPQRLQRMRRVMRQQAKRSLPIAPPATRTSRVKTKSDHHWPASSAARAGRSPAITIRQQ